MPLQSDSLIVEVEIWDLCLPVAHMYDNNLYIYTCVPLAGYDDTVTPQLEVLKHLGHPNFVDNRLAELKRFFYLSLFGWDDVWMKYGLSLVPRPWPPSSF